MILTIDGDTDHSCLENHSGAKKISVWINDIIYIEQENQKKLANLINNKNNYYLFCFWAKENKILFGPRVNNIVWDGATFLMGLRAARSLPKIILFIYILSWWLKSSQRTI